MFFPEGAFEGAGGFEAGGVSLLPSSPATTASHTLSLGSHSGVPWMMAGSLSQDPSPQKAGMAQCSPTPEKYSRLRNILG